MQALLAVIGTAALQAQSVSASEGLSSLYKLRGDAKEGAKEGAPEAAGAPMAKHFVPEDARDPAALGSLDKAALAVAASVAVAGVGLAAFAALRTRPA